jgi:hypothetical protein
MTIIRANAPTSTPEPGMIRQIGAFNEQLMLVRHLFK